MGRLMKEPLISIGLLTYNHEKYIASALEGLIAQEYKRIELIVLDDASNDNTSLYIEMYMECMEKRFERVVYFKNKENRGNIPYNCNRIIKEARGEFYYEISGDDILLPQGIGLLCEALQNHLQCVAVHANMIQIPDSHSWGDAIKTTDVIWKNKESGVEADNLFQRLMYGNCIAAPTVMLRREIFYKYGYHDEMIAYEDYEYWLRISRKEKFYFLNKPVVLYRKAETSITNFDIENDRLQIAIEANYLIKKKYIKMLSESEQIRCWKAYYTCYIRLCTQYQYRAGLSWLEEQRRRDGIKLDELQINYKNLFEKQCEEAEILAVWVDIKEIPHALGKYLGNRGICNIAIYGYSRLGVVLHKELLKDGVKIDYIIDQKGKMLECSLPVYTIEDNLPIVDAIIVAPINLYEKVKKKLGQKTNAIIMELVQLLNDLRYKNGSERTIY